LEENEVLIAIYESPTSQLRLFILTSC